MKKCLQRWATRGLVLWLAGLNPCAHAQINSWTNTVGGKWEDTVNWSLGLSPSSSQSAILITNGITVAGFKAIVVDGTTAASFPATMTVSNVTVANADLINILRLTNAGTNTPLHVMNSLTITNGGVVNITNSALQVDGPLGINGDLTLRTGAQMIATNAFTSLGFSLGATGQVTMSEAAATLGRLNVGSNSFSVGTFTMNAGNLVVSNMWLGVGSNSLGAAWISDSTLVAITSVGVAALGRYATGQLSFSNTTAYLRDVSLAGSVGSQGTFTMVGSTVTFSAGFTAGRNSTGSVFVSDGRLIMTNGQLVIGGTSGVGQMIVTNASVLAASLDVPCCDNAQGTFTAIGSSLTFSNYVVICDGNNSTGALWLTDSQLQLTGATNGILISLGGGVGQMTLSNNSAVSAGSVWLGGKGTVTMQGGTMSIVSNFFIADSLFSTGTVWMSGGQVTVSNGVMTMGQVTISNGFVSVWDATVASTTASSAVSVADSAGTLTVVGGSFSASSSLIMGKCASNALGQITVSGGQLCVTNATHTGYLDLRGGTFTFSGGSVIVDQFILTNACAQFVHTGGTLIYGTAVLDPNRDDDGDGIPNGWEQAHGLDPLNAADANTDSDGDGFTNLQEYLAGTDPTNSASAFHITSLVSTGNDILINWMTGIGRTNALQASMSTEFSNNFTDLFTVTNAASAMTNYLDSGGAINAVSRFYRIRLVP